MMLPATEASGDPINLALMLERRDARAATQHSLLKRFNRPLAQLTLVNPGAVKDTAQSRFVFDLGLGAMQEALSNAGHGVLSYEGSYFVTGPEMLMVVDTNATALKRTLMAIEDQHPLGRLWDVDVIDISGVSLSRQHFGLPARRCLVCEHPAHDCARSRLHALTDLHRAVQDRVDAYRSRQDA